jgi:hypothetical protein
MSKRTPSLDEVSNPALRLPAIDKLRLLARVASALEQELLILQDAKNEVLSDFRTSWQEAMADQTLSIDELWASVPAQKS